MIEQTLALTPRLKDDSLPTGWSVSVSFLCRIHRIWRLTEKAKIYKNPSNFLSLIGGHVLNFGFHDNRFVKLAALSLLAIRRLSLLEKQLTLTKKSYKELSNSAHFIFGSPEQGDVNNLLFRIKLTAKNSSLFLKESATSSLRLVDVIEALTRPNEREAINEIFVNTVENAAWLGENRNSFIKSFKKHELTIKKIFVHLNVSITTEEVILSLETTLKTTEKVATVAKALNSNVAKKALFGFANTFGVDSLVPDNLIEEEEEDSKKAYFIPNETLKLVKSVDKQKRFKVQWTS